MLRFIDEGRRERTGSFRARRSYGSGPQTLRRFTPGPRSGSAGLVDAVYDKLRLHHLADCPAAGRQHRSAAENCGADARS